ncbi:MAG: YihY family inner membrane protein, partial [Gammaproteobacteria bacterium]|nr:YihY family inner membrane protein [Gammaproteobacteria bacterium]
SNTRKVLYRFLVYWALLTLGPILMAVSLTLTAQFFALPIFGQEEITWLHRMLDVVWPLVFETGAAVLLYSVVPNASVRWRYALVGGVFAAVLIEIAKRIFAYSMKTFTSYQVVYGAVAALPIFLVWIYITWVIVLLGAIVVATLNDTALEKNNGKPDAS